MEYYFNQIKDFKNPQPLFFLCGVKYNEKEPNEDKRVVLKKFLDERGFCSIILEENFVVGKNNVKLGYKFIELKNLNDVETLACMLVDGIFVIHESHSTAAEIALFASNDTVAKKVFVMIPDGENAGENHFSGFLLLGYGKLLPNPIVFYPVTEKLAMNEYNARILTYFQDNKIGENLGEILESYIDNMLKTIDLSIIKSTYDKTLLNSTCYYSISPSDYVIFIHLQHLRYYMVAIFNISEFRSELRETSSFIQGLAVCVKWYKKLLLNTVKAQEKIEVDETKCKFEISNSINTRIDLRKAIAFTLYSFHALGWIRIEPDDNKGISISKRSETAVGFKTIYEKYKNIIFEYKPFKLEDNIYEK